MKELTRGAFGEKWLSMIMTVESSDKELILRGSLRRSRLKWSSIKKIEFGKVSDWFGPWAWITLRSLGDSSFGNCFRLEHEMPKVPSPIYFISESPTSWLKEFTKHRSAPDVSENARRSPPIDIKVWKLVGMLAIIGVGASLMFFVHWLRDG